MCFLICSIFLTKPQGVLKFFTNDTDEYQEIINTYKQLEQASFLPKILTDKIEGAIVGKTAIAFEYASMGNLCLVMAKCKFF